MINPISSYTTLRRVPGDKRGGRTGAAGQAAGVGVGKPAPLGIDAKYKYTDQKTGEIIDPMGSRIQRFILQSIVRKLLPNTRTNNCLRVRQKGQQIQVLQSVEHGTASYGGLQTCGSVWQCPVCAAKISERRRVEVLAAITAWKAQGGTVNMLTLTCPHQRTDKLADLLAKQAKALNYFWMDRQVKTVFSEMANVGHILSLIHISEPTRPY